MPAELAPFLAEAREQVEAATDGLQPAEAIQHLESKLAETEAEALRMGLHIGSSGGSEAQASATAMADGDSPVVVIRQMVDPGNGNS